MGISTKIGNVIIPTDELTPSFFRGVGLNHQSISHISHISGHIECSWLPQRGANIEAKDDNECLGPPGRSAPYMMKQHRAAG